MHTPSSASVMCLKRLGAPRSSPQRPFVYTAGRHCTGVTSDRADSGDIYTQRTKFWLTAVTAVLFLALVSIGLSHQAELHAGRWQAAAEPDGARCYHLRRAEAVTPDYVSEEQWYPGRHNQRFTGATTAPRPSLCRPGVKIRWFRRRTSYGANTDASRQLGRFTFSPPVLLAGDIEVNPGPALNGAATPGTAGPRRRGAGAGGSISPSNQPPRSVTVTYQNCRSLRNKPGTLRAHSSELQRSDAIAITETRLTQDVADAELQVGLSSHSWFRRDRPTHGGGVACAIRSSLSPVRRHDLEPDDAELLLVELGTTPRLIMGVCYCPPADGGALDRTMTALQAVAQRYPDRCLVVSGDFNIPEVSWSRTGAGWAAPTAARPTRRAANFLDACNLLSLKQYVCYPTRGANTLDLVLSNRNCVAGIDVQNGTFDSDHKQVNFVIEHVRSAVTLNN